MRVRCACCTTDVSESIYIRLDKEAEVVILTDACSTATIEVMTCYCADLDETMGAVI